MSMALSFATFTACKATKALNLINYGFWQEMKWFNKK